MDGGFLKKLIYCFGSFILVKAPKMIKSAVAACYSLCSTEEQGYISFYIRFNYH